MGQISREVFTVPNAITFGRLAASPYMAKRLKKDPAGKWLSTAFYAGSDMADGLAAKMGDISPFLAKLGFRKSELGRLLDPSTDKVVIPQLIKAGLDEDIIPGWLAAAALTQKAAVTGHSVYTWLRGAEVEVSWLGKKSEFASGMGMGFLFAAEGIEDSRTKDIVRKTCIGAAVLGIVGAVAADVGYARSAHEQLAQHPVAA